MGDESRDTSNSILQYESRYPICLQPFSDANTFSLSVKPEITSARANQTSYIVVSFCKIWDQTHI